MVQKRYCSFKEWLDITTGDSTFTLKRNGADKIILNLKMRFEFNLRNNWKKLNGFRITDHKSLFL
jgi:hypothetical protein